MNKPFKIRPRSTKVIDVRFPALLKYRIAFCYAKSAEVDNDFSLYTKAEVAVLESYQTAVLLHHKARILYLWGYILFKQGRYEEAIAKFEAITPRGIRVPLIWDSLYAIGKAYSGLGDDTAAQRAFNRLETKIDTFLRNGGWSPVVGGDRLYALGKAYMELNNKVDARRVFTMLETQIEGIKFDTLHALGKTFMELNDEAAALRIFARIEGGIERSLQQGFPRVENDLYTLGKAYLELGDDTAAQRAFAQLLEHYPDSSHKAEVERLLENWR